MARVLIVGCGCRGRSLAAALVADGHAVRGTTRSREGLATIEQAGAEGMVADPDRLGTLMPALAGVTAVCWLMGTAEDGPAVNGDRLETFVERLVDTPVRGLVYEAAGSVDGALLERGAAIVRKGSRTWRIPVETVDADPSRPEAWLAATRSAVERLLAI